MTTENAGLGVGHIWYEVKCPAYRSLKPADCTCNGVSIAARLEELRAELRAERISMGELIELQGLAEYIEPGDVELLEPAGVPEFDEPAEPVLTDEPGKVTKLTGPNSVHSALTRGRNETR